MNEALRERLLATIVINDATGCWEWTGQVDRHGYGRIKVKGSALAAAHRLTYEEWVAPIAAGFEIDHLCRTPGCVNPEHLEPVTHRENVLRGTSPAALHAAKTHCLRGHPFDEENTLYRRQGGRQCRACERARHRRMKERRATGGDTDG